jgi:uncharacterized protein
MPPSLHPAHAAIIHHTEQWLTRAVIGLNLCPFAKAVHVKKQIHYAVSTATTADSLLADLETEISDLIAIDPSLRSTTLLIAPDCMEDFLDFNDFLAIADLTLRQLRVAGVLQIASFHPSYQFADTEPADITNFTNRAPYPILHLLREDEVARAVAAYPDASEIVDRNLATMQRLGTDGWHALGIGGEIPK